VKGAKTRIKPALAQISSAVDIASNLKEYLLFNFALQTARCKPFILKSKKSYLGCRLKRNEAITCLKEILHVDNALSPEAVTFQELRNAQGYTLHIKGITQQSDREIVEEIAKKYGLTVKNESDGLTIFKPFPPPSSH
jgi:hypothetical protein